MFQSIDGDDVSLALVCPLGAMSNSFTLYDMIAGHEAERFLYK